MSIAVRYGRASRSSHLEVRPEEGDIDVIAAAGMAQHKDNGDIKRNGPPLGFILLRVRDEFDKARSAKRKAERVLAAAYERAAKAPKSKQMAAVLSAEQAALAERALVFVHLGSLAPAARAIENYALGAGIRGGLVGNETIRKIARDVLDVFIDPTCPTCNGTGTIGNYGAPQAVCHACRGAQTRQPSYGKTAAEHDFGRWLLDDLSAKMHEAERLMRQKLRQR